MWINKGDTVKKDGKILEVVSIEGLYSIASNVKITLKDTKTKKETTMPYMSEFYPQVEQGKIEPVSIRNKNNRGY